ncbi:MAG: hypothetical protein H8E55_55155 [Pelagibacterales bacterium]|nr:hypothetical protein [Pelagibacterales bacterium]
MKDTKKIAPMKVDIETYKKLQLIVAKYSHDNVKFISIKEAFVNLIDEKYKQISGSIKW